MRYALVAIAGSLALTAALPAPSNYILHEKRDAPAALWYKRDAVPSDMLLPMRIGLKQRNLHKGHELLMDVSYHKSANYGNYYTAEEVNDMFAPEEETVDSVRAWLIQAGIAPHKISQSANKAWLQFDATAEEAEQLLKTKYHFYEHERGDANVACDEYHLPSHIQEHVDYITPGIKLLTTGKGSKNVKRGFTKRGFGAKPVSPKVRPLPDGISHAPMSSGNLAVCDEVMTPQCIAALYDIPAGTKKAKGNELGIYEWGDTYSADDLNLFFGLFATQIPNGTHPKLDSVDGAIAPSEDQMEGQPGDESALDFQISYPIIWPQNSILYQTDDQYYTGPADPYEWDGLFNNFLDAIDGSYCTYSAYGETGNDPDLDPSYPDNNNLGYTGQLECGVYKPTNVISVSYGENEYDLPLSYQERQCNEWLKLGLQGVSVVFASGDSGVAGRFDEGGHGNGCLGDGTVFNPGYPGTCPFMTVAGATYLPKGSNVTQHQEVATSRFKSGGGFSNLYEQPWYQREAVNDYLTKYAPKEVQEYPYYSTTQNHSIGANGGLYNRDGRAYPDVSAVGDNILVVVGGEPGTIGGTSAAAPAFAAVLTRINEERLAIGKNPVGFINPVIYAHPEVFNDITSGDNEACVLKGFSAAKGWDPVTGLGTPNYPKMLEMFLRLGDSLEEQEKPPSNESSSATA